MGATAKILRAMCVMTLIGFFVSSTSGAAELDIVLEDFRSISGYVVMSDNGEYVIDLDVTSGVSPGNIFSVIGPGKEIIHPVTKKAMGTLEKVKALLKVTRVKPGYSFARRIGAVGDIQRGDKIRRYGNLKAVFWDYTAKGKPILDHLESNLTDLKWTDYESSQQNRPPDPAAAFVPNGEPLLIFILTPGILTVNGPETSPLHRYTVAEPWARAKTGRPPTATTVAMGTAAAPVAIGQKDESAIAVKKGGIKPKFKEVSTMANLPNPSLMADFLKHKNQLLMASTDGKSVQVFVIKENVETIASSQPSYIANILAVKWWQPDKDGPLFIAATAWSNNRLSSILFEFNNGKLRPYIERVRRILGSFDLNGDGAPETLLGQEYDGELFYGQKINLLRVSGTDITYSKPSITFPRAFTVLGSIFVDLTGDGKVEAAYIRNSILWIYSGNKLLYRSTKEIGGSLSFLNYDIDPTFKDVQTRATSFEVSPVAVNLDGDNSIELVCVASEKTLFGTIKVTSGIKKSWMSVLKYQDGRFVMGTLGEVMELPIQGLDINETVILMVATETGNLANEILRSHLLYYSLD